MAWREARRPCAFFPTHREPSFLGAVAEWLLHQPMHDMPFELSEKTLRTGFSVRIPAKSAARGRPAHRAGPPRGDQSRHRRKSFDFFSFAYSILPYGWNLSFPPRIILERIYANRGNRDLHLNFELLLKTGALASTTRLLRRTTQHYTFATLFPRTTALRLTTLVLRLLRVALRWRENPSTLERKPHQTLKIHKFCTGPVGTYKNI